MEKRLSIPIIFVLLIFSFGCCHQQPHTSNEEAGKSSQIFKTAANQYRPIRIDDFIGPDEDYAPWTLSVLYNGEVTQIAEGLNASNYVIYRIEAQTVHLAIAHSNGWIEKSVDLSSLSNRPLDTYVSWAHGSIGNPRTVINGVKYRTMQVLAYETAWPNGDEMTLEFVLSK